MVVVGLVDGLGSILFVCVGVGIVLLVGPARLGPVMFGATPGLAPVSHVKGFSLFVI